MTWHDFLKYTKYIAVFYGISFAFVFIGIWSGGGLDMKMIWSGILFFGTALAANVALGSYHYNHKSEMKMAKNIYLAEQAEAQVITSDGKGLQVPDGTKAYRQLEANVQEMVDEAVKDEVRRQRGY